MVLNETAVLSIIDNNENGIGIAKHDGLVIFVPDLVAGDTAEVQITELRKNYAVGKCLQIIERSNSRIHPICKSFTSCGGCTLCHISYELENRIKRNILSSAFRRAGIDSSIVEETVTTNNRTQYRNKVGLHYDEKTNSFGYFKESSNTVIPFNECHLVSDEMNEIVRYTNENISLLCGVIPESMFIRSSTSKKTVVTIHGKGGNISNYKDSLIAAFPSISDVIYCRTDGASATAYIEDEILGLKMRFSSEAFRQVNSEAFSKLLSIVHEMADNFPFKCAADLYCGSGIIGLSLAKIFPEAKFWGIEINSYAVADAKYNAQTNELKNIEFFCGDAAAFRTKIGKIYSPELVIVDPPRAGLSTKMREGLFALSPKKIIYVSCNPQTLARDIAALGNTYTVKRAVPVNMFPMTKHCEAVVLLSRKDG